MFDRPEELIVAVLAAVWLAITYFLAAWATLSSFKYTLMITFFTALWLLVFFQLWRKEEAFLFYPILLGLLVACWCPWLDWYMLHSVAPDANSTSVIVLNKPWYARWTFKLLLIVLPILAGYAWEHRRRRQRKMTGVW